jgi:predicted transcriptional regulator
MSKGQTEAPFHSYIIIFIVASLFLVSLISFSDGIATQYNSSVVLDQDLVDTSGFNTELNTANASAANWANSVKEDTPDVISGFLIVKSIWGVIKLSWSSVTSFVNLFNEMAYNVLGIPAVAIGVATAIIMILLIFAAWKAMKQG